MMGKDYDFIKIGNSVFWNDPSIGDYDEEDRASQLAICWTISAIDGKKKNTDVTDDTIVLITSNNSEAEVTPNELESYRTMKCTDFWRLTKQLKFHELKELRAAIEAHGGSYWWYDSDNEEWANENYPIVLCNHRYAGPVDVNIRGVWINNDSLCVLGEGNDDGVVLNMDFDDICVGHISSITESLPVINGIEDVSIPIKELKIEEL